MEERHAIQKAVRVKYAILIREFRLSYCKTCRYSDSDDACENDLLPVTTRGEACPYHRPRLDEALQLKSEGIEPKALPFAMAGPVTNFD